MELPAGGRREREEENRSAYLHKRVYVKLLPHTVPIYCYYDIMCMCILTKGEGERIESERQKVAIERFSVPEGGDTEVLAVRDEIHWSKVDNHTIKSYPTSVHIT